MNKILILYIAIIQVVEVKKEIFYLSERNGKF